MAVIPCLLCYVSLFFRWEVWYYLAQQIESYLGVRHTLEELQ